MWPPFKMAYSYSSYQWPRGLISKYDYTVGECHIVPCSEVIMGTMASQISSFTIVYLIIYSGVDQRKHQSPASLAFVREIHRWPVNSPHKGPVTWKKFNDAKNMYQVYRSNTWTRQIRWWFLLNARFFNTGCFWSCFSPSAFNTSSGHW